MPTLRKIFALAFGRIETANALRGDIRVLTYHGVVARKTDERLERNLHLVDEFRSQINFLRRFPILGLDELIEICAKGRCRRKCAAAITFDDGYVNNLMAAEILEKHRLPWTLFVSTGVIGSGGTIWTVELSLLMLHGEANCIELYGQSWALRTRDEREHSFQAIRSLLKHEPALERRNLMDAIRSQFPSGEPVRLLDRFPGLRILSWDQLSQLAGSGVAIGSHGVDHELHHERQPDLVRLCELVESKATLEKRLGRPCRAFAFPNGDHGARLPLPDSRGRLRSSLHHCSRYGHRLGIVSPCPAAECQRVNSRLRA